MTEPLLVTRLDIWSIVRARKRDVYRLLSRRDHSSIAVGVLGERRFHDTVINLLHDMLKGSEWKLISVEAIKTVCHVKVSASAGEVLPQLGSGNDLPPGSEPIVKLELGMSQRQPASLAEA